MNTEEPAIIFAGYRTSGDGAKVIRNGEPLGAGRSLELRNHSPTGFEWGYAGSGPAQLALALLLEITTQEAALLLYQDFKHDIVVRLPRDNWVLTDTDIQAWLNSQPTT